MIFLLAYCTDARGRRGAPGAANSFDPEAL